jgi:hypothetical protein
MIWLSPPSQLSMPLNATDLSSHPPPHSSRAIRLLLLLLLTQLLSIATTSTILTAFSPANNFLVTCSKPIKDAAGNPDKNVKVWDLRTGTMVQGVPQKQVGSAQLCVLACVSVLCVYLFVHVCPCKEHRS